MEGSPSAARWQWAPSCFVALAPGVDIALRLSNTGCSIGADTSAEIPSLTYLTSAWKRAAVGLVFIGGCGGSPSTPAAPTPVPSSPTPPPTSNRSSASVAVEDPFAIVFSQGSRFGYAIRFLLRETSGASGATIEDIVIYGPSGSDLTGQGCWRDQLRLPAGGALDTFYTDAGAQWLGYRGPGSGGTTASPMLEAEITFRDDRGVGGSIRVPVTSLR